MRLRHHHAAQRKAFTLVELAVVIVIIGVLAAFGVPRFIRSVERTKTSEAFAYLSTVQDAQERYRDQNGAYAKNIAQLEMVQQPPRYFSLGTVTATKDSWTLTLTRLSNSSGYGQYTIIWGNEGLDSVNSSIASVPDLNLSGQ